MAQYDYLIVGAGLFGATFAHLAQRRGRRCLVVDRRDEVGGNLYCEKVEGINVHKYGAHIFHTSDAGVWRFVNSLVEFNRYTNSPVANHGGRIFNLPFNMNTFAQMWGTATPEAARAKIEEQRQAVKARMAADGIAEPRNLEEQARLLVGDDLFSVLIEGYTEKQWGRKCSDLPAFIIKRLPLRFVYDNNYFNDTYQGIPIGGYNRLIDALLQGCEVRTGVDFLAHRDELRPLADRVVFTGAVDEYFGYRFGPLNYRTVRFEQETMDCANYQGNAVVNYTSADVPYTRVIEHKHFEMFGAEVEKCPRTVVSREYSTEWTPGMEPYYPVNDDRNNALYAKYRKLAEAEPDTIFGGRLAEYKYYDMHVVVRRVLDLFAADESL